MRSKWLHQPKLDGWRCQAVKVGKTVTLYSRHGHDITKRFPTVAAAVAKLGARSLTLDGERVQADALRCHISNSAVTAPRGITPD